MPELAHIVIVDSDPKVRGLLSSYLQSNGFRASAVADGRALYRLLDSQCVDLIVLDPVLPKENGLSICKRLRAEDRVPVIILTAKGSELDRVHGLEFAEDYVGKPFSTRELLARIKNVLARWNQSVGRVSKRPERYRFARWTLDTISRTLIDPGGKRRPLGAGEYRLLEALASQANRVLTRDELMELTKGREATAFDRSIDVQVSRLRRLLGEDARAPAIIKTIYGEGYVMGVRVETE